MNREDQHKTAPLKVIISGGGTGGHVFPALAIAKEIKGQEPDASILFIGAKGRMEMEKIPSHGFPIKGLWISGFSRGAILKNIVLPFKIISSIIKSWWIIRSFKPDIAIGTGGFASAPLLYVASKMKVPSLIQEQNFFPGVTNRLLAKTVNTICVVYESLSKYFPKEKMVVTGNPVRNDLQDKKHSQEEARANFNLTPNKKTFFVLGGSLGARSINEAMKGLIDNQNGDDYQGIWQTGQLYYQEIMDTFQNHDLPNLTIQAFIDDMPQAYKAADLVICRAGAITLAELAYLGQAAILIPSPNVAEDHQAKNAKALVDENAAIMLRDNELDDQFREIVHKAINDEEKLKTLSTNIQSFARPNATKDIVKEAFKMAKVNERA